MKEADAAHPYGYATERYVWSLISGLSPLILPQHALRPTYFQSIAGCIRSWLVAFVHLRPKDWISRRQNPEGNLLVSTCPLLPET